MNCTAPHQTTLTNIYFLDFILRSTTSSSQVRPARHMFFPIFALIIILIRIPFYDYNAHIKHKNAEIRQRDDDIMAATLISQNASATDIGATTTVSDHGVVASSGTVEEFFAHKNIFVTGGTGFLGTVMIEALLGTSPNVGTIYLLVRDKYGSNAITRTKRMLTKPVSVFFYRI